VFLLNIWSANCRSLRGRKFYFGPGMRGGPLLYVTLKYGLPWLVWGGGRMSLTLVGGQLVAI